MASVELSNLMGFDMPMEYNSPPIYDHHSISSNPRITDQAAPGWSLPNRLESYGGTVRLARALEGDRGPGCYFILLNDYLT